MLAWFSGIRKMSRDIEKLNRDMSTVREDIDKKKGYMDDRISLVSDTQLLMQIRLSDIERRLLRLEADNSSGDTQD